ncbi:MAG: hypothetical protein ACOY5B_07260 [Spirochaetota bacterium]
MQTKCQLHRITAGVFALGLAVSMTYAANPETQVTMTVTISEPHNPKKKEEKIELKTGKKKGVRKHCRLEVDATQGYFVCDNPAFSMTLQENNSLLVGKKLYRIQSIRKQ